MSWQPSKWHRIGNRSKYHLVHQEDPTVTWCGLPTDWEPYQMQEPNKARNCTTCKKKDQEWLEEVIEMKRMQRAAEGAKW